MGDISQNFRRSEFACGCNCGFETVDTELLEVLEGVRAWFDGSPIRINSGCRCDAHNRSIRGSTHSKHRLGIAADIAVQGIEPQEVFDILDKQHPNHYGLGNYSTFTHIDVRGVKARWKQTNQS